MIWVRVRLAGQLFAFGLKEFISLLSEVRMDIAPGMEIFSSPTMASACN